MTRPGRVAFAIASALLMVGGVPLITQAHASSAAPAGPIVLNGEGTYDIPPKQLTGWFNDLYGSATAPEISMGYVPLGGPQALSDLLSGLADYAISGVPYTASQLSRYPGGASGIIAAPVMASATGFMFDPPPGGFYALNGSTANITTYAGKVRVPADNLIAQLFSYTRTQQTFSPNDPLFPTQCPTNYPPGQLDYAEWDSPAILSNWDSSFTSQYNPQPSQDDPGDIFFPCGAPYAQPVYQAESNESTYYMELWGSEAAPNMWSLLKSDIGATNALVPSGQIQSPLQKSIIFSAGLPESLDSFVTGSTFAGNLATSGMEEVVPPSGLQQATTACQQGGSNGNCKLQPAPYNYQWIYVQNFNGDWVAPSPDSIDAAVDALPVVTPTATGGEPPLYPATTRVPGAYPLTYVDYMYLPAHGEYDSSNPAQSTAKIEALATVMRYLATTGQGTMAQYNDGVLSSALQQQALAAANQFVQNNCPASGTTYLAVDNEYHCGTPIAPPATTTTTTVASHTTTTVAGSNSNPTSAGGSPTTTTGGSPGGSGSAAPGGSSASPGSSASGGGGAGQAASAANGSSTSSSAGGGGTVIAGKYASGLPFARASGTGSGLDKLVALAVGAGLFLLFRRWPARWLQRALDR